MSRVAASKNILQKLDNLYKENKNFKDAADTLLGASIAAGGQALFTDMTPEEIAIASTLGIGAAYAIRPIGEMTGKYLGRQIKERLPKDFGSRFNRVAEIFPGTPGSPELYKGVPLLSTKAEAGYKQNFKRPDGTDKTLLEGLPYMLGREYSDQLAQLLVAAASPTLFNRNIEEDKSKVVDELRDDVVSVITQ